MTDIDVAAAHRRVLECPGDGPGAVDAEGANAGREVGRPHRAGQGELAPLQLRREAGERGVEPRAVLADGGDDAAAGAGQRAAPDSPASRRWTASRLRPLEIEGPLRPVRARRGKNGG